MSVRFVFIDLDDTLLDFKRGEHDAVLKMLRDIGFDAKQEHAELYNRINASYWKKLERGEVTRENLKTERYVELFRRIGCSADPKTAAAMYEENLSSMHYEIPGASELLKKLRQKYKVYIVSNGGTNVQHRRLHDSGIEQLVDGIFISSEVGYDKPHREFFDCSFETIEDFDRSEAVIVGDSLSSDIKGGISAEIRTVLYDPRGEFTPGEIIPDCIIGSLDELPELLKTM